MEKELYLRA